MRLQYCCVCVFCNSLIAPCSPQTVWSASSVIRVSLHYRMIGKGSSLVTALVPPLSHFSLKSMDRFFFFFPHTCATNAEEYITSHLFQVSFVSILFNIFQHFAVFSLIWCVCVLDYNILCSTCTVDSVPHNNKDLQSTLLYLTMCFEYSPACSPCSSQRWDGRGADGGTAVIKYILCCCYS